MFCVYAVFLRGWLLRYQLVTVLLYSNLADLYINHATTPTPTLLACPITLRHSARSLNPANLSSDALIRAISYTCFKLTSPTCVVPPPCPASLSPPASFATLTSTPLPTSSPGLLDFVHRSSLPGLLTVDCGDNCCVSEVADEVTGVRPGALAPRRLPPLPGSTPAAVRRRVDVGGVRSVKRKDRSGRTVTRAGTGVPGTCLVAWR